MRFSEIESIFIHYSFDLTHKTMAEPLSTIASLIAVAQISGTIISICYDYRHGLKNVSSSVTRLSDEVRSLRDVLENLIELVDDHPGQFYSVELLDHQNGPLSKCSEELQELQNKLQPQGGWKAVGRALKWPLSEPELLKVLSHLDRMKTTITVAIATDQMFVSSTQLQKKRCLIIES